MEHSLAGTHTFYTGQASRRHQHACWLAHRSKRTLRPHSCRASRAEQPGLRDYCRRPLLASALLLALGAEGAHAAGLESLPQLGISESKYEAMRKRNRELQEKNDEAFENSDILRSLKEKTVANKDKYRKDLQDRYCYRQAELGVGDCGGLRLVPGATKSGKQKTPPWLEGILRKLGRLPPEEATATAGSPKAPAVELKD